MADSKGSVLDPIASVDRATDKIYIIDASGPTSAANTVNSILGITGDPVGTSDSQTVSGKIFTNTNILTIKDNNLTFQDNDDTTKQFKFQASGITAGATRVFTLPDYNATLATIAGTETFTNKTLTSPVINTATISNPTLTTDTISEHTAAAGVTVDGLLIKDGLLPAGNIQPLNLVSGTGSTWVWQSWVPIWTNLVVGNGTITGRYVQIGNNVFFTLTLVMGSTSAVGTAPTYTLPITAQSSAKSEIGSIYIEDAGVSNARGASLKASTTTATLETHNATGTFATYQSVTATVPITWGTGDIFRIQGFYEAA